MKNHKKIIIIGNINEKDKCFEIIKESFPLYKLEVILNAKEGLKRILKNSFDLVILDFNISDDCICSNELARECILMGKPLILCSDKFNVFYKLKFWWKNLDLKKNMKFLNSGVDKFKIISCISSLINKKINPTKVIDFDNFKTLTH